MWHWGYKKDCWGKIRNDTKKGGRREQSLRMMNVSYARTSNITYVKQQQQDDQMRPSSIKTRIKYSLLIWLAQVKTIRMQSMERSYRNINNSHSRSESGRRPGYNVMIIPIVIDCLGEGKRRVTNQIGRLITDEKKARAISNEMLKTILFESESITRKVLSGLIQEE